MIKAAVEALKGSPGCLAAVLLAGVFGMLMYREQERAHDRFIQYTNHKCWVEEEGSK